jgi:beta-lactamase regulating signal transducer with metallopeptidase domain
MEVLNWMRSVDRVALGWTLLHFCWQGVAIALLYVIVDKAAVRAATTVRYGITVLALALMPAAVLFTLLQQERLVVHVERGDQQVVASELGAFHSAVINRVPIAAPIVESGELWIASNADSLLPWIDGIWLAGVLLLAVRAFGGWWQLERLRRRAQGAIPAEVSASFHRLAAHLKIGRHVALRISNEVISPLAMGVWRTSIILPVSAVMALEPAQLEAVLAHELAHVRRWDYLCNLLQTAIECLLFFHPAVWWMSRRMRDLREICCDEVAARSCSDPVIYAEALLQLEEQRAQRFQLATALHGRGGTLVVRVRQILGEGMTMESKTMNGTRIAVASAVLLALFLGPKVASGLNTHATDIDMKYASDDAEMVGAVTHPPIPAQQQLEAPMPAVASAPAPAPAPTPTPAPAMAPAPMPAREQSQEAGKQSGLDYIRGMRDAGYPMDLNKDLDLLISLRSVGVTPEYAKRMAQVGFGTPKVHELVTLKAVGVSPEYIAGLKASGIAPANFNEVVSEKSLGVTPEYSKAISSIGLGMPDVHDLISLKAMGITPEYVAGLKASGIAPKDLHEVVSMKAVGVTPEYAKEMSTAGFGSLPAHELISLRAQGGTPEYIRWVKTSFPNADIHQIQQAAVFHIDEAFVAKAKSHGFSGTDLGKLVKLKISGLLD